MKRRELLIGIGAIGAVSSLGLNGCSLFADPRRLQILGLENALPGKILKSFKAEFKQNTEIITAASPPELWQSLQDLQVAANAKTNKAQSNNNPPEAETNSGSQNNTNNPTANNSAQATKPNAAQLKVPDLTSLSDAWLDVAIAQDLIRPIPDADLAQIPQWQELEPRWKDLVTRNGEVWGIPYRWGTTVIAYRPDKTKFEITGWHDLWRSQLKGRIVLPDNPREVIGLVLKKLAQSYNRKNSGTIAELRSELEQLHQQVLFYSSDRYLQPLIIEDAWAVVGWSNDVGAVLSRNPRLKVVVPQEGTALWSDIWVLPKQQPRPDNIQAVYKWINYTLSPAIANQITAFTDATSTMPVNPELPERVRANPLKFPQAEVIAKSEILSPLSKTTMAEYLKIWQELRSIKTK
jgi:putative spermidine/putrescine transport system substrate-binding protein